MAVHQENAWQPGDENGKEDCHKLSTQRQPSVPKNFPVGGGAWSLTPSLPVTSAASPSNFANLYQLFVYLHTIFFYYPSSFCTPVHYLQCLHNSVYFRLCTLWHFSLSGMCVGARQCNEKLPMLMLKISYRPKFVHAVKFGKSFLHCVES